MQIHFMLFFKVKILILRWARIWESLKVSKADSTVFHLFSENQLESDKSALKFALKTREHHSLMSSLENK